MSSKLSPLIRSTTSTLSHLVKSTCMLVEPIPESSKFSMRVCTGVFSNVILADGLKTELYYNILSEALKLTTYTIESFAVDPAKCRKNENKKIILLKK